MDKTNGTPITAEQVFRRLTQAWALAIKMESMAKAIRIAIPESAEEETGVLDLDAGDAIGFASMLAEMTREMQNLVDIPGGDWLKPAEVEGVIND